MLAICKWRRTVKGEAGGQLAWVVTAGDTAATALATLGLHLASLCV